MSGVSTAVMNTHIDAGSNGRLVVCVLFIRSEGVLVWSVCGLVCKQLCAA